MKPGATISLLVSLLFAVIIIKGCTYNTEEVVNPFNEIAATIEEPLSLDSTSMIGIQANILEVRCALPGCHDGNFEPDFRTAQSSHSTLVYHPVTKNNETNDFRFRVVPYMPDESVLIERITNCCFVNIDDRMPQDNIGEPLAEEDIESIRKWIEDGAKDMFGQEPTFPNTAAQILFYVGINQTLDSLYSNNRLDGAISPFLVPDNETFSIVVGVRDDSTAVANIQSEIRLSFDQDDFTNATVVPMTFLEVQQGQFWRANINTATLPKETPVFFRIYAADGNQQNPTEFPRDETVYFYKSFYSFYVVTN